MSAQQQQLHADRSDNLLQSRVQNISSFKNDDRHLNFSLNKRSPPVPRSQYHSIQQLSSSGKSDHSFQNFATPLDGPANPHPGDGGLESGRSRFQVNFQIPHSIYQKEFKIVDAEHNKKDKLDKRSVEEDSKSPNRDRKASPSETGLRRDLQNSWSRNFFEQYRQRMMASVAMALAGNFRPNVLLHHYLRHSLSDLSDAASCLTNCSKNGELQLRSDCGSDSSGKSKPNQGISTRFSEAGFDSRQLLDDDDECDEDREKMTKKMTMPTNDRDKDRDKDKDNDRDDDNHNHRDNENRKSKEQFVKVELEDGSFQEDSSRMKNPVKMESRGESFTPTTKQNQFSEMPSKRPKRKQYIPQQHESGDRRSDCTSSEPPPPPQPQQIVDDDDDDGLKNVEDDDDDDEDDQPLAKMKCTRSSPVEMETLSDDGDNDDIDDDDDDNNNNCKMTPFCRSNAEERKTSEAKIQQQNHQQHMAEIGMRNYMTAMMQARMDQHHANMENPMFWSAAKSDSNNSDTEGKKNTADNDQLRERNLLAFQVAQQMEKFSMLAAQNSGDPGQAEHFSKMLKMELGGFINGIVDNLMSGWLLHQHQQKIFQQTLQESRNHRMNGSVGEADGIKVECDDEFQVDSRHKQDKHFHGHQQGDTSKSEGAKDSLSEGETQKSFKSEFRKSLFEGEVTKMNASQQRESTFLSENIDKNSSSLFAEKRSQDSKTSSSTLSSPTNSDGADQSRSPGGDAHPHPHFLHPMRNGFLPFPMNPYFAGHFLDSQVDQTRSDPNSSPIILNDDKQSSSPKLFPSNLTSDSFSEAGRSFVPPPMYKSSMIPPFYPPALSRFKNLFMSMKDPTEQTEAIPLVVNTPKKKRTKVTDTRLSPRAARAMLHESYSNHHQAGYDSIKQDPLGDVPLNPLDVFNYHLYGNPGGSSLMQNFTDLFKHTGYMGHPQSAVNPDVVNNFSRNPRGEDFPHLPGQPHHLSHGGIFNLIRPGLARADHLTEGFRKSPSGCHHAGIPFRELPRHSQHITYAEGAYPPSPAHHPFRFHHPMFMARHHGRHSLPQHHSSSLKTHHHQASSLLKYGHDVSYDQQDGHNLTSTLTPMHLRKAKLMFFYVRYPSSAILKIYFPDVRFNKNNTAQLVKWFSNFREFYYIQMEKYARQALAEGVKNVTDLVVGTDSELYRVLVLHYNRNNQIEVPENFRFVVQATLREFYLSIAAEKDQEQSWKKSIYKIIARMDDVVPEYFKSPNWMEQLADQ